MSDKIARAEAELALLKAEAAFTEKKAAGKVTADDKNELRALRQEYRENWRKATKNGAQAGVIATKVGS